MSETIEGEQTESITIESDTKRRISGFLPDAIAQALGSYYSFAQQDAPPEAKEFSAHHNACKVAIAHIELLIKLARWADVPEAGDQDRQVRAQLAEVLQRAQGEVEDYNERAKATDKRVYLNLGDERRPEPDR